LFETGPALAESGVAFVGADRRGSGLSGGDRGDVDSFQRWIDDYAAVLGSVRERYPSLPLTLTGQSRGGAIAAAVAAQVDGWQALLLAAPHMNQHVRLSEAEWSRRRAARRVSPMVKIPIPDEHYTNDPELLRFMAADELMLRYYTPRYGAELLALDEHIANLTTFPRDRPAVCVMPAVDRITDTAIAGDGFARLTGGSGLLVSTPADAHYLEFSCWRRPFWKLLAVYAISGGFTLV
jgi:alpha-beta hydrolase superfamily lysophospholipase